MLAFWLFFMVLAQCAALDCGPATFLNTVTAKCVACPVATFCVGNCIDSCNTCPPNTFPNVERTNCVSGTCVVCPIGSYCGGGLSIVACPAGTYASTAGLLGLLDCTPCAAGTYNSGVGMTTCLQCAGGSFAAVAQMTICTLCSAGTYQTAASSLSCQGCEHGTYSVVVGLALPCVPCQAGSYGGPASAECLPCPGGTFASGIGTLENNCTLCAAGTFSTAQGATAACKACDKGFYQPVAGSLLCFECPPDTFLDRTGARLASDCVYCAAHRKTVGSNATSIEQCLCIKGYAGLVCDACPSGTYADEMGQSKCTVCPAGTYDPTTSVVHSSPILCKEVPANAMSLAGATDFTCLAGYHRDSLVLECPQCPTKYFSQQGDAACTRCTLGTTTGVATSQANCSCDPGSFKNNTVCQLCPANFYCNGAFFAPIACALGKSGPQGASVPSQCVCQAGWWGADGTAPCNACSEGFYCPAKSLFPRPCLDHMDSLPSSTQITDCVCIAGFKSVNGVCTMCSVDEFCLSGNISVCRNHSVAAVGGATSQADCSCSPGFWSVDSTAICQVCPEAYYCQGGLRILPCPNNADTNGATQRTSLLECFCKPGYYGTSTCNACPPGSYCSNSKRIDCALSASSAALSSTVQACVCDPGFAGTFIGCVPCSGGVYTTASNSSQCTACAAGSFSAVAKATTASVCAACVAGSYALGGGATVCVLCPEVITLQNFKIYFFA